jgi:hypothetical protein
MKTKSGTVCSNCIHWSDGYCKHPDLEQRVQYHDKLTPWVRTGEYFTCKLHALALAPAHMANIVRPD